MKSAKANKIIFNKKNGIILSLIFFQIFILTGFCGCNTKTQKKEESKTELRFSWWGKTFRHNYTLKGIDEFEKLYPQITIKPEYSAWSGYEEYFEKTYKNNENADVMQINFNWLYKYSSDGNGFFNLFELSDHIELFNFTQNDLSFGMMDGKLNAIPIAFNAIIPIFDKTLFSRYKLPVPETWNELFSAANLMKKDGIYPLGMGEKHLFLFSIAWFEQTHGKKFFSDNTILNITEEETEEFLVFIKKMFDQKVIFPNTKDFESNSLEKRNVAGAVSWCNESSQFARKITELGGLPVLGNFISTPTSKESGWYLKPSTMYAISKNCKHPKEAAQFLNFLLNSRQMSLLQKCEKGIPASNKSLTVLMENKELETMEYDSLIKIRYNNGNINSMLPIMENSNIIKLFSKVIDNYNSEKTSLKESAQTLYSGIKKIAEK